MPVTTNYIQRLARKISLKSQFKLRVLHVSRIPSSSKETVEGTPVNHLYLETSSKGSADITAQIYFSEYMSPTQSTAKKDVVDRSPYSVHSYTSEEVSSGSEYEAESKHETSDSSDDEPLSKKAKKNRHTTHSPTPKQKVLSVHVTADSNTDSVQSEKIKSAIKPIFSPKESKSRVRTRNPDTWKKRKAALAREHGQEYISYKGKQMPKKEIELGLLFSEKCRLKCSDQFNQEDREMILKRYYSMNKEAQTALIFNSIDVKRHKKAARRHSNRPTKIKEEVVNFITDHISQFPAEESHYSRNKNIFKKYLSPILSVPQMHKMYLEKCEDKEMDESYKVKLSFYEHIFKTKFNLSFGHPKSDTCSVCDSNKGTETHTENYHAAFDAQNRDKLKPQNERNTVFITMDLQQTMPLPKLTTNKAFYLRQLAPMPKL
ncbi:unnamed protein product [Brassicogethes aeneus]|uniref:Uncharacterized protein n=1 Tax=Brassicogethes aeneus TaxID=1431903 RepID=A0A9P0BGI4_BRAAE|nr:unnamed protein product [Brassicogethes aeneus]